MKHPAFAIATTLLLALPGVSRAAVAINSENSIGTDFPSTTWAGSLSGIDLINAGQPTLAAATVTPTHGAFPGGGINDGTSANAAPGGNTFFSVADPATFTQAGGTAVATYDLNVSTAPAGYDITSIQSVMGWMGTASQAQANQTYTVAVSVVGSTDYTDLATVSYTPFTDVNGTHYESRVIVTENTTGILAAGVDSIRFTFLNPLTSVANGPGLIEGTLVREIDVLGAPSDVVITPQSSTGTPFASTPWAGNLSGTDLINAGQPSLAAAAVSTAFFGPNGINNGNTVAGDATKSTFFSTGSLGNNFPATATYDLDVSTNAAGYDLTSIQSFMGWPENSATHANQNYTVAVSYVGSADYSDIVTVSYNPFGTANSLNHESHVLVRKTAGVLATGVDSIRFTFAAPVIGGSVPGTVVREVDVHGYPTGSSPGVVVAPQSSSNAGAFAALVWAPLLSGTDLINAGQASLAAATVSAATFGPNGINNGSALAGETNTNTYFAAPGNFPATATYDLNVSANPLGYAITSIRSFMGWQSNSGLHANQTYTVEVSTVGDPGYTLLASVNFTPFSGIDSIDHESAVTLTESGTGELATGVDSIRFIFANPGSGGGAAGTVVREIDVHGYAVGGPAAAIAITRPVSRQVIQRGTANSATVAVSGSYSGTPDSIEARLVVMPGAGNTGSDTAWTTLAAAPAGGTFAANLTGVAAGGWYQLEVRPVTAGTPGAASVVERIGVGDIFVTCGQSNAANHGAPAGTVSDDRVSAWNFEGGAWTKAADPMPGATGSGGSVWPRLGDLLAARDQVPIGFVCLAVGATSVSQWLPPDNYYPRIRAAMQAFPVNGFRAVLWHQGESDSLASTTPADYQNRLQSIIAQSRADAGWTVPWYLAEVGFHPGSSLSQEEPVVAGQRRVIYADAKVFAGPVTDDFHLESKLSDSVHFNAAGLADHAAQWAEVLGGTPPLAPKNGDFESNPALADGGIAVIDSSAVSSPSVIGWRVLAAAGEAVADQSYGYYNPDDSFYAGAADDGGNGGVLPNMSGRHVAFLSFSAANAHFLQTRRALLAPGRTYRLTVALGVRSNSGIFGGATLELLADGVVLTSRAVSRAELDTLNGGTAVGTFTEVSLELSTGSTVIAGQPLAVRIRKTGGAGSYLDFDNVRLVSTATPYAAWQLDHWGATADPAAAWTANPDGDTFTNGLEYYLGGDPKALDAALLPTSSTHDGKTWQRFQVPLDPAVDSSGLEMWYSFDLATWQPAATNPGGTVVSKRESNSWSLEISATDHHQAFVRLNSGSQPD